MTDKIPQTLGELKDAGMVPSDYQIWRLEMEESSKCRPPYGPSPHLWHVSALMGTRTQTTLCPNIYWLRKELMKMFPSLKLDLEK